MKQLAQTGNHPILVKEEAMHISLDLDPEEIIYQISTYSDEDVFEFIQRLELARKSTGLTEMCRDYFVEEMMKEELEVNE